MYINAKKFDYQILNILHIKKIPNNQTMCTEILNLLKKSDF